MPKKDGLVMRSRYKSTISFVTARSGKAAVLNCGLTPIDSTRARQDETGSADTADCNTQEAPKKSTGVRSQFRTAAHPVRAEQLRNWALTPLDLLCAEAKSPATDESSMEAVVRLRVS
jgi:hypothetical protein